MDMRANRRRIIMSQPHKETATGENVAINVGEPKIEKLAVTFSPAQSGSGTPSPSNVRPISGWTDIGVQMVAGKNLFDNIFPNIDSTVRYRSIYVGDSDVTVSTTCGLNSNGYTVLYALPGQKTTGADSSANGFSTGHPRTITPVGGYITIGYRISGSVDPSAYTTQVEYGTTATTIEPYRGITPSTSLGGTYYGGTVDLVSGTMTVTHGYVLFDGSSDEDWKVESMSIGSNFYVKIPDAKANKLPICNVAKGMVAGTYAQGECRITGSLNFNFTMGAVIGETTVAGLRTWLASNNTQVAYELSTPQTVTLTPQTIAALRGQQTVASPAGTVDVTYWTR